MGHPSHDLEARKGVKWRAASTISARGAGGGGDPRLETFYSVAQFSREVIELTDEFIETFPIFAETRDQITRSRIYGCTQSQTTPVVFLTAHRVL